MDEFNEERFDESSNLEEWTLQLDKIVKSKDHLAVTRLLAASLQQNPYMTVGTFFKTLSDWDLEKLLEMTEAISDEGPWVGVEDILLLTMMLSNAEGSPSVNMDELHDKLTVFCVFVAGTSLARKGLVKAHFDNMSFNEDSNKLVVFEKV